VDAAARRVPDTTNFKDSAEHCAIKFFACFHRVLKGILSDFKLKFWNNKENNGRIVRM
jgi:hypothetical protein